MSEKKNHKLGVIVPYRDRETHLKQFKKKIKEYLHSIDYELIIVEQFVGKKFNRGKLLNIGFELAVQSGCDYVVFHDVDMIPVDVDYSYSGIPLHLSTDFENGTRTLFDEYFGGVTLFPVDMFKEINGYSNEYWGWGYEDDDLLYRCKQNHIPLEIKDVLMMGSLSSACVEFNGINGYVILKNTLDLTKFLTIFVSFHPSDIICDPTKHLDKYSVFTIPGQDLSISYNSFKRYTFEIFDSNGNMIVLNSEILPNYKTNICITINPVRKEISMYQDGELIDSKTYEGELYTYDHKNMFIGTGSPYYTDNPKYFKGTFDSLAIFNKKLTHKEIVEISKNRFFGLTDNFGDYRSSKSLQLYYDPKFVRDHKLIDLTGSGNDGEIVNCDIVGVSEYDFKSFRIPHRRPSTFKMLKHKENGYVNGKWKTHASRMNQVRFHNEVLQGKVNIESDGLSNCEFMEMRRSKNKNETHVIVRI